MLAFFIGIPVQYYLVWIEWYGLYSIFIPVYGFSHPADRRGDTRRHHPLPVANRLLQWGLMICVFCVSHIRRRC